MLCHFIPPYLAQRVMTEADGERRRGASTLRLDSELRARRSTPPRAFRSMPTVTTTLLMVHDARHGEQLPGEAVRSTGEPPTGDPAVDEVFRSGHLVRDMFLAEFDRRSVDGDGGPLSITVHYGQDYDNAFWDGRQLVFGDGDRNLFERFTRSIDVVAHEFMHGVTQFTAGLGYQGQPGALNESMSDVFAAMARQRSLSQSAEDADWLIGADIFAPGVRARALRSLTEPGTAYNDPRLGRDPQVGSMAEFVETEEDSGGVHVNSGIPSRAFALAALAIGGSSWEQAGQCWYDALTSTEVTPSTDFASFARATVGSARQLYPADPRVAEAVDAAWKTVGVLASAAAIPSLAGELATTPGPLVAVSRTGGFAGLTRSAELDLDLDPLGPEVRDLLTGSDLASLGSGGSSSGRPSADRFVYTLEYGEQRVTLPEQDLTPELHRVVQIVLGRGSGSLELE
jgi:hypothetical protein